ncbi:hypothetical protein L228DRAFT_178089 [Xylona heveae TC161]|uniref:HIG1 domain-containing protein n=1 Tax=Xylona heveae (strain CBS 132557 / TC161) TaxID=1328760 RepID=A0A165F9A7_XYLHT|nr:hypothetical protein L228DRAFT_178089 [Xylona heveae TC161]KZF20728.1 hypothetical protein L228DRAFT_178089 [Xylona heveae TC161]
MKILTKEEEQAHYNAVVKGGLVGGALGLAVGGAGIWAASARFPAFRSLTIPMRTFLFTSSGTFAAIINADRSSRAFEISRHPDEQYRDESSRELQQLEAQKSSYEKFMDWGRENRYPIVGVSWLASMAVALGLVGRNPYLSTQQKLVQARVYAQGLTLAVLVATAAFEIGDAKQGQSRWQTVKVVDPNDPEHKRIIEKKIHRERYAGEDQWMDMVETEERKLKEREQAVHAKEQKDAQKQKSN